MAILRVGTGAAALQAGLIKALDFPTTVGFMADAGWRLPGLAAFMVTAAETLGGLGLLLGAAAVFGVTLMVQQDTKPPLQAGDPASSVLNRVEYGNRS